MSIKNIFLTAAAAATMATSSCQETGRGRTAPAKVTTDTNRNEVSKFFSINHLVDNPQDESGDFVQTREIEIEIDPKGLDIDLENGTALIKGIIQHDDGQSDSTESMDDSVLLAGQATMVILSYNSTVDAQVYHTACMSPDENEVQIKKEQASGRFVRYTIKSKQPLPKKLREFCMAKPTNPLEDGYEPNVSLMVNKLEHK